MCKARCGEAAEYYLLEYYDVQPERSFTDVAALPPGKEPPPPRTHWIGGWVDPRAGMGNVEKRKFLTLPGLQLRSLGRPARSQSLYRLRYPGSLRIYNTSLKNVAKQILWNDSNESNLHQRRN
jgi:hypothetical protein